MLIFMTTTSRTTSDQVAIDDLAGVRGKIITRSDPEYGAARAVYNGAVDRYPLAIVRCADVAEVIACVTYARNNVVPLAIRGGGHHGGGFGVGTTPTPATMCCRSPSVAVATMVAASGFGTTPSSSTSAAFAAPQLTRRPVRSVSTPAASGAMSIMPPERSAWPCLRASCPRPGLVA